VRQDAKAGAPWAAKTRTKARGVSPSAVVRQLAAVQLALVLCVTCNAAVGVGKWLVRAESCVMPVVLRHYDPVAGAMWRRRVLWPITMKNACQRS
jgi:hypothetical protein